MDNLSVISLSSTSSKSSRCESSASIITVSSDAQQSSKALRKKGKILEIQKPPEHTEKVDNWMKLCDQNSTKNKSPVNETVQNTCIRYDFDKKQHPPTTPKSCFTRATPLFSYMEEAKKASKNRPNGKSDAASTPLSPESQKKELCSYLQLMKPDDKPSGFFIEYRRSGRMKNPRNGEKSASSEPNTKIKRKEIIEPNLNSDESNLKTKKAIESNPKKDKRTPENKLLPLPPKTAYCEINDFDESVMEFVNENSRKKANGCVKNVEKKRKFKFLVKLRRKLKVRSWGYKRFNLRSRRHLRDISLEKKKQMRKKAREKRIKEEKVREKLVNEKKTHEKLVNEKKDHEEIIDEKKAHEKLVNGEKSSEKLKDDRKLQESASNSRCEIITIQSNPDEENVDLRNFVNDMLELDKMSEEHRKSVIESRILASSSITNLINKRITQEADVQKAYKIFSDLSNERKSSEEKENAHQKEQENMNSSSCEIITVQPNSDDENIDLRNFVDDMLELDKMSEEHRKSVIESRILASDSITHLINKRTTQEKDVQRAYKIFSDLSNDRKSSEEAENPSEEEEQEQEGEINSTDQNENMIEKQKSPVLELIISEHDYAYKSSEENDTSLEDTLSPVPIPDVAVLPVSNVVETKSLHSSLTPKRKTLNNYGLWNSTPNSNRKLNHSISISKKNGIVLHAFYQDHNLLLVQRNLVSFWTQSALGNVLGAQNMWIPKGEIQRIALNATYKQKSAMDMAITTETSVAFVELWTKEHKSEVRQVPLADVFATVYFWRLRQTGLEKKALQLENIQGFADDVQFCVLKNYPKIIVSWYSVQGNEKKTKIHSYHLAADFQTVANISEIQPVEHHVGSLHNIEDCDSLIMGCGENKITLWNVEYGYVVATVEMTNVKAPLATLWVKCDRGFLFTIQECVDQELRLIAVNGMNHSWKKLQNYNPISGFNDLKGVCVENGILVAYYSQGILCWNAQTGELIVEEAPTECEYIPNGKHVIMIVNENIIVRHSLSYLITDL